MPDHVSLRRGLAAAVRVTSLVAVVGMGAAGCASSGGDGTDVSQAPTEDREADTGGVPVAPADSQGAVPADGVRRANRSGESDSANSDSSTNDAAEGDARGTFGGTARETTAGSPARPQPAQWSPPVRGAVDVRVTYRPVAGQEKQVFAWHGGHQSLRGPGVTYYLRDRTLFACTRGNPAVVCVEAPPQESHLAPYDDVYAAFLRRPGLAIRHSDDTVAGRRVTCPVLDVEGARAMPSLEPGSGYTACLDRATGLVLRLTSERDGLLMEAARVVDSSASDVELPAPPLPLPVD